MPKSISTYEKIKSRLRVILGCIMKVTGLYLLLVALCVVPATMIRNRKFEPLTVWNKIELRYRITASHWTS